MVNHPLHRLFVPLFYSFTYHSLIWLNNSLSDLFTYKVSAVTLNNSGVSLIECNDGYIPILVTVNNSNITTGVPCIYYADGLWAVKVYNALSNNGGVLTGDITLGIYYLKVK